MQRKMNINLNFATQSSFERNDFRWIEKANVFDFTEYFNDGPNGRFIMNSAHTAARRYGRKVKTEKEGNLIRVWLIK